MNRRSRVGSALLAGALLAGAATACGTDSKPSSKPSSIAWEKLRPDEFQSAPDPQKLFSPELWATLHDPESPLSGCKHTPSPGVDLWDCSLPGHEAENGERQAATVTLTEYGPTSDWTPVAHATAVFEQDHMTYPKTPLSSQTPLGDQVYEVPPNVSQVNPHGLNFRMRNVIVEILARIDKSGDKGDETVLHAAQRALAWNVATDLSHGLTRLRP
ncbi:hypothetical protein AB0L06_10070 [Spirillospora sp. NPDC052269]